MKPNPEPTPETPKPKRSGSIITNGVQIASNRCMKALMELPTTASRQRAWRIVAELLAEEGACLFDPLPESPK